MEWSLHKGKRFFEFIDQPDKNGANHFPPGIPSRIFIRFCEKGPENGTIISQMVRDFPIAIPNGKSGVPQEVVHNFRKDFPENCLSI